jgi:dienelactone hydrolase
VVDAPVLPPAQIVGHGTSRVWIGRPRGAPKAVVVYVHGWGDYSTRKPWLVHLRERGDVVLYPQYQRARDDTTEATVRHLGDALRVAFARPGLARLPVVAVGYSWGAKLVFDFAERAKRWRVPLPRAVMSVFQPSLVYGRPTGRLPSAVRVLLLSGDSDNSKAASFYRAWLHGRPLTQAITIRSRGTWVANHEAPARADALARRLFWSRLDALVDWARR